MKEGTLKPKFHPIIFEIGQADNGSFSLLLGISNLANEGEATALGDALIKPFQVALTDFFGEGSQFIGEADGHTQH